MNHWLQPHAHPLVIGHRGASAHAPENTLAGFCLAREQGADGIDVKRCASGDVVVMHDPTLLRTTGATGFVHEWMLADLRTLDAGQGERVPTLDEVFDAVGPDLLFNVEVTNYTTPEDGLEPLVIDVVRRHNIAERIVFSSFHPMVLLRLAALAPDIPRGFLYDEEAPFDVMEVINDPLMPHEFRHPHYKMVTPEMVVELRTRGIGVNTWTVNQPADIIRMAEYGVAGIIGDSPKTIREVLGL
jgi:glycerophosphoryl diester phosphodiesterase